MAGSGSKMQWCKAFLVHLVNVGATFDELVYHHVLPVVAGHVKRCVAVCVGLVDLDIQDETVFPIKTNRNLNQSFGWKAVISTLDNYRWLCDTSLNLTVLTL